MFVRRVAANARLKVTVMGGSSALDWTLVGKDAVQVGDIVSAEAGGMPIYRVVALADGQAWLREEEHAGDQVLPLGRLHWKARTGG
jgi:hypothetical protein